MRTLGALTAAVLMLSMQQSAAQEAPAEPVVVELKQFKVVKDGAGNEELVDAATVRPGDILEYRVTYRNVVKHPIAGLVAELPIPDGTQYQPASALPARIPVEAATENKQYAREPLVRTVQQPDGTVREEQVPYPEYRSLRWKLGDLPAGRDAVVSARVQVTPLAAAPTKQQPEKQERAAAASTSPPF